MSRLKWQLHAAGRGSAFTAGLAILVGTTSARAQEIPQEAPDTIEPRSEASYTYVRALDGSATLIESEEGERVQLRVNEPVLVGDRLFLSRGSRAELVLSDGTLLRVDGGTDLGFDAIALSPERGDSETLIDLRRGSIQLVTDGRYIPVVVTPNSVVNLEERGSYVVEVRDDAEVLVVVRSGLAFVDTDAERAEVRAGESLAIDGSRAPQLRYADAGSRHRLERWGDELGRYGDDDYGEYIDDDLRYASSSLSGQGSWVYAGSSYAWRPRVSAGWSPYHNGRWRYTPTGLFWVSYEPWGHVPYHYGSWDYVPTYGWVWYPGRRFRPAHVYWYWGPKYVGWIPSGYYNHYYRGHYGAGFGQHGGIYGYVGGHLGSFRYWLFTPISRFGHHRLKHYAVAGLELRRHQSSLARGILTGDTRHLGARGWKRPGDSFGRLRSLSGRGRGGDLPDAQPFIERTRNLPGDVQRVAMRGTADRGGRSAAARLPVGRSAGQARSGSSGGRATRPVAGVRTRTPAAAGRGTAVRGGSAGRATVRRGSSGRATVRGGRSEGADRPTVRRTPTRRDDPSASRTPERRRPTVSRGSSGGTARAGTRTTPARRGGSAVTRSPRRGGESATARPSAPATRRPVARGSGRSSARQEARAEARSRSGSSARVRAGAERRAPTRATTRSRSTSRARAAPGRSSNRRATTRTPRSRASAGPTRSSGRRAASRASTRSGSSRSTRAAAPGRATSSPRPAARSRPTARSSRGSRATRSRPSTSGSTARPGRARPGRSAAPSRGSRATPRAKASRSGGSRSGRRGRSGGRDG